MGLSCDLIIDKVNELIELRLNKGISPSELMENISNDEYIEVSARKLFNGMQCNVTFYDNGFFDDKKTKYNYIYLYDKEMFLNKIKIVKDRNESIVWSREAEESKLLEQILHLFNKNAFSKTSFVNSLPADLYKLLLDKGINYLIG